MNHSDATFRPAKVAVITVSDTRTEETDTSGRYLRETLAEAGHDVVFHTIIKDEPDQIRERVAQLVASNTCGFVILTGGTGFTPRDGTPEALAPLYTKRIPGFGELFRHLSYAQIGPATIQSRAEAGLCGHAIVFALPGSTNACRLAMEKIILHQIDNTSKPCNFRGTVGDPVESTPD
ncbi:Molybdenum cofactor biosynthesis protein B [Sulfidibacter corallicola]|uniref:Molybdenum cofactor biosynthesis protein B n=1 Tax=Sulfidibacter corallicola TaxID=2818388 RepID=A0A8A4TDE7_SULCO|nr:molybdenum cofactor synthesis domain-containing protein [Sulfidibacter corallicola]QTD48119.1 molybdenum cofactor biosynthesis protein [Sulfidibacter corallicola]